MAYIQRTIGTPTSTTTFTFSFWCKAGTGDIWGGDYANVFSYGLASNVNAQRGQIQFNDSAKDSKLVFGWNPSGSSWNKYITNRKFRDTLSWYHIVVAVDTSQASAGNRVKIYINGEQETSFGTENQPSQNFDMGFGTSGNFHRIGAYNDGSGNYQGYLSHFHFCDGTQYQASDFGETDSTTGEWKIKTDPSVTYGNNGFFLFKDDASLTDQSGNSNNFSATSGTIQKSEDNPSNLFCTLNGITSKSKPTLSLGNLKTGSSSDGHYVFGTQASKAGYYEIKLGQNPTGQSGSGLTFGTLDSNSSDNDLNSTNVRMFKTNHAYSANYSIDVGNGAGTNTSVSAAAGDIINVAWKNGKLYCGKNGTYFFSANPSNNTDGSTQVVMDDSSAYQLPISKSNVDGMTNSEWNFGNGYFGTTAITTNSGNGYQDANGQGKFQYQPPTGCYALCTKNLNV